MGLFFTASCSCVRAAWPSLRTCSKPCSNHQATIKPALMAACCSGDAHKNRTGSMQCACIWAASFYALCRTRQVPVQMWQNTWNTYRDGNCVYGPAAAGLALPKLGTSPWHSLRAAVCSHLDDEVGVQCEGVGAVGHAGQRTLHDELHTPSTAAANTAPTWLTRLQLPSPYMAAALHLLHHC